MHLFRVKNYYVKIVGWFWFLCLFFFKKRPPTQHYLVNLRSHCQCVSSSDGLKLTVQSQYSIPVVTNVFFLTTVDCSE